MGETPIFAFEAEVFCYRLGVEANFELAQLGLLKGV